MDPLPAAATLPDRRATEREWAVVDVETSGLRPSQHRVLSVAVLTLDSAGELIEEFSTLLDPGCDPGPVHIHGLTPQRLCGAPAFEEVADRVGALLTGRVMVVHNAQFDYDFLPAEAGLGLPAACPQNPVRLPEPRTASRRRPAGAGHEDRLYG